MKAEMIFSTVSCAIIAAFTALFIYWLYFDKDPKITESGVEISNSSGIKTNSIKRGSLMLITRNICVSEEFNGLINRILINKREKTVYILRSGTEHLVAGCRKSANSIFIPNYVSPGIYEYLVTINYDYNPISSTNVHFSIPEINVTD